MQVSAIGNPNFQGRRDRIDELISLDDNAVQKVAYLKTYSPQEEKKHRKITNGLFYAAPIAAGLGAALFTRGKSKIFSKEVSGLAARVANGLKTTALWGGALAAIDLLGAAKKKLAQNSPEVRRFAQEHPFLSLGTMLAAGFGVLALVGKGAGKLAAMKAPKVLQKYTVKTAKFINNNSVIGKMKSGLNKLAGKTPSALKEAGSVALDWAPQALLLGGLFHSISHASAKNREFAQNYNELKEKQLNLSKARQRELLLQNDFLMQEVENRENIALVKEPLKDLPEEVIEKINDIHQAVEQINDIPQENV